MGGESWIYFYLSLGMGPSDSAWLVDGFGRFDLILTNFDLILIVLTILSKITNKYNTTMGGGVRIYFYFSFGMGQLNSALLVDGFGRFDPILTEIQ